MVLVSSSLAALIFAQYWFSDKIAMFSMQAKVTPEQEPKLHEMVDRLCALANMPKPHVGVAETDMPNAFATGRNPNHAVICATRGIMLGCPTKSSRLSSLTNSATSLTATWQS